MSKQLEQDDPEQEGLPEKTKVPRGTCSECYATNNQHQKFCSKSKIKRKK